MQVTVSDILTLLNAPQLHWLVLVIVIGVICLAYAIKTGALHYKSDRLEIGRQATEHENIILRRQIEYISNACGGVYISIPRHDKFDPWRTKFVIEKVIDEMTNWCLFNHISVSQSYIEIKQATVWNIIQRYIWHEMYQTDDFKQFVNEFVKGVIEKLVLIRKESD